MAQVIFSNIAKKNKRKDIIAKSAGTDADENLPMTAYARQALIECGEKLPKTPHKSRRLTIDMQNSFDKIIDVRYIADPWGSDLQTYISACKQLQHDLNLLYDKLCKTSS